MTPRPMFSVQRVNEIVAAMQEHYGNDPKLLLDEIKHHIDPESIPDDADPYVRAVIPAFFAGAASALLCLHEPVE